MADHDWRLEQISNVISEATITRRGFVMATLAAGFALAVQPVSAETLTTDQTGLTAGEIQIQTTDGHIPAYRARPGQGTALPVVLVVQEIFGVHEHIKDICRRFAKLGYRLSRLSSMPAKVMSQSCPIPMRLLPRWSCKYRTRRSWLISTQPWPGQKSPVKGTSRNSVSRASAGEEELCGCMRHTIPN